MDRTRTALRQMAREDPELAARLVLQTLPAAVRRIPPPLAYELTVRELGTWRIAVDNGDARVERLFEATGDPDGLDFRLETDDGARIKVTATPPDGQVTATVSVGYDAYRRLIGGEVTPAQAMREQLTDVDGDIYPVTLLGRWIERSQGRDDAELERERRQREVQLSRAGTWGGIQSNGSGDGATHAAAGRSVPLQVEGTSTDDGAEGGDPAP